MKKILVCQHVAHEVLGTLDPLLRRAGFRIRYVNFARSPQAEPALDGYRGLVVLGGPMSANHGDRFPFLTTEIRLIEEAMRRNLPVLGICLGAQLIAKTLGASVYPNREKEIGWFEVSPAAEAARDPLLRHLSGVENIFQWHGDTFDLPHRAAHLASSELCVNQAFRYGASVYGLQFHLEVDEPMIRRWLMVSENQTELASLGIDPAAIEAETPRYIGRLKELSERVFGEFIGLFGREKKLVRLPLR